MDMKIFIHAGPGKTGTSAIQKYCVINNQALRENGVFYPKHNLDQNGISSGNLLSVANVQGSNVDLCRKKIESLLEEFRKSECHTLVLSSEYFFNFVAELKVYFSECTFIFYARSLIELLESNYKQGVKRHGHTHLFRPPDSIAGGALKHIVDITANNKSDLHAILIRPYSTDCFYQGDLISDFFHAVGVSPPVKCEQIMLVNTHYTYEALEYKRYCNAYISDKTSQKLDSILQSCNIGNANYTLIPDDRISSYAETSLRLIDRINQAVGIYNYDLFVKTVQRGGNRQFVKQGEKDDDLSMIVAFLETRASPILEQVYEEFEHYFRYEKKKLFDRSRNRLLKRVFHRLLFF